MTAEAYLREVLTRHTPRSGPLVVAGLGAVVEPCVRDWAGRHLRSITVSGSNAKGTAVGGQTDVDFFISLDARVSETLEQIYWSLYRRAHAEGWNPQPQNVSIGVEVFGSKIDLVPARVQPGYINRHSLYRRKVGSWTMTDISQHISLISGSGRTEEIRLAKIWRAQQGLEFPSFALELAVLEATRGRRIGYLADNFLEVLRFLSSRLVDSRLVDPSNSANIVSDDLTAAEKAVISRAASAALIQKDWRTIIW